MTHPSENISDAGFTAPGRSPLHKANSGAVYCSAGYFII